MIKVTRALTFEPAESKLDKDWIIGAGSAALTSSSNALKPEVLTFAFVEAIALHKAGKNAVICGVSMIGYLGVTLSMHILHYKKDKCYLEDICHTSDPLQSCNLDFTVAIT